MSWFSRLFEVPIERELESWGYFASVCAAGFPRLRGCSCWVWPDNLPEVAFVNIRLRKEGFEFLLTVPYRKPAEREAAWKDIFMQINAIS